jgi:tetratricopeptide (TPR) repeat protein
MSEMPTPLDPHEYSFWTPEPNTAVSVGPEETRVILPEIPLPIGRADLIEGQRPTDKQIGVGIYNYLRRFPDCPFNAAYAKLLKDAYAYYISDLGAQIIMLESKDVDPPYVRRKISYLKILALLEPANPGLLLRIGAAYFELALIYSELIHVRRELMNAVTWLQKSLLLVPKDRTVLNYLGQTCYLLGDYSAVTRYWRGVIDQLPEGAARRTLQQRLQRIADEDLPVRPLVDDFETVGVAMEHYHLQEFDEARLIMDRLEEEGSIPREMPSPDFYYFVGLCREKAADSAGAFQAYEEALAIDAGHAAAAQGRERILDGKEG